jgi:hypothetical protein
MADETDSEVEALAVSALAEAGIAPDTLAVAANAAKRLVKQSGPVEGGAFRPPQHLDYQSLFRDLARKTAP